jgi:hypothetical protein
MAERLNAPVLKTGNEQSFVGSNPTPSAISVFFPTISLTKRERFLLSPSRVISKSLGLTLK